MSVATCVTVVVPIGKTEPLANPVVLTTDCTPQLSCAVGVAYVAIAPTGQLSVAAPAPSVASRSETVTPQEVAPGPVKRVLSAGAVTTGLVSSTTVTVCVSVALFPERAVGG